MNVTAFVERIGPEKYRAVTSQPVPLEGEGSSPDEALQRLRDSAQQRLSSGKLVQIEVPAADEPNPWIAYAGVWKDHPDFDEFLENIAEHRRKIDEADAGQR